jgi:hypothetical protein
VFCALDDDECSGNERGWVVVDDFLVFKVFFHVPSKYMFTALSMLLPQLFRITANTSGGTFSPTKLSKVSWSNAVETGADLDGTGSVRGLDIRFNDSSTSFSERGGLPKDEGLEEAAGEEGFDRASSVTS